MASMYSFLSMAILPFNSKEMEYLTIKLYSGRKALTMGSHTKKLTKSDNNEQGDEK